MKRFGGCLGVAVLAFTLAGCDGGEPQVDPADVAPDGRPAGFEDMMKGMSGQMKKGSNPREAAKATKSSTQTQDAG